MAEKKQIVTIEIVMEEGTQIMFQPNYQLIITKCGVTDYETLGMLEHAASIMKANIHYRQFKEKL